MRRKSPKVNTEGDRFYGTKRFDVQSHLGRGGMGAVYRVYDRDQQIVVALKTILNVNPKSILRFKQEFRCLADVTHPNLVTLYELVRDSKRYFFTMELVDGTRITHYIWGDDKKNIVNRTFDTTRSLVINDPSTSHLSSDKRIKAATYDSSSFSNLEQSADSLTMDSSSEEEVIFRPRKTLPRVNYDRLRSVMHQLVDGICALHRAGFLHRDIKPSNILVTPEERVVLLDFGIIAQINTSLYKRAHAVEGTPLFIAPEVAAGKKATEASDWYSVGVVLHMALTGRTPFIGDSSLVIKTKQHVNAPSVTMHRQDCPSNLVKLCNDLLSRNPQKRPTPEKIHTLLGERHKKISHALVYRDPSEVFVGRSNELSLLERAFNNSHENKRSVIAHVHAESGIGKTALTHHFLEQISRSHDAIILAGRCYERETLPYKALDALIDALAHELSLLPNKKREAMLPKDMHLLGNLFAVLQQGENNVKTTLPSHRELHRRAFAALRHLLSELAKEQAVVLFIDDAQWGDEDSANVLQTLFRPPNEPPILLILSYRSDEAHRSPLLLALNNASPGLNKKNHQVQVELKPLSVDHSTKIVDTLVSKNQPTEKQRQAIIEEARGNPFFLNELIKFFECCPAEEKQERLDIKAMLRQRVKQLSEPERRLVEVVAVAGHPLPQSVAQHVASLTSAERAKIFPKLQTAQLIRLSGRKDTDLIEPYHARISEHMIRILSDDKKRTYHLELAKHIEQSKHSDPEVLAQHFDEAGKRSRAAYYVLLAAEKADQSLAFIRAAELYAQAQTLQPYYTQGPTVLELMIKEGRALTNAGHGEKAAKILLQAAKLASQKHALRLRHRAADELIRSGYIDQGLDLLEEVLKSYNMPLHKSPRRALTSLLWNRLKLASTSLSFKQKQPEQMDSHLLEYSDLCQSVGSGLIMLDSIRGSDFQTRSVLLARRSGDSYRFSRALAMEAGYFATQGGKQERYHKLIKRAKIMAEPFDDAYLNNFITGVEAVAAFEVGLWSKSYKLASRTENELREHLTGVSWELAMMQLFKVWSLIMLGQFNDAEHWIDHYMHDAQDRGDMYLVTNLRTTLSNMIWLVADDVNQAQDQATQAIQAWSQRSTFFMQHHYDFVAQGNIDLYNQNGEKAIDLVEQIKPRVRSAMMHMIQFVRITLFDIQSRGAICVVANTTNNDSKKKKTLKIAEKNAKGLINENVEWSVALGETILGQVAVAKGDRNRAQNFLNSAIKRFEEIEMGLHLAATRYRLGELQSGDKAHPLKDLALNELEKQNVKNPKKIIALFAPLTCT